MSNKRAKLSEAEIAAKLGALSSWSYKNGKLHRDYQFADFVHAFGFMSGAALLIGLYAMPDFLGLRLPSSHGAFGVLSGLSVHFRDFMRRKTAAAAI